MPATTGPAKQGGKQAGPRTPKRLGLAGRVAMIAVAAAVVAALAQWVIIPPLAQSEIRHQRHIAVTSGANLLADVARVYAEAGHWSEIPTMVEALSGGLPEGQSAVFDADWALLGRDGADAPLPSRGALEALAKQDNGILTQGSRFYAARPVIAHGKTFGYTVYSFVPRPFVRMWLVVVSLSAVVLSVTLLAIAPLVYRLARLALKPVTDLERRIRSRDPKDKSKLADSSDDRLLKPLLAAIDEAHERSEAAMRRALALAYTDPATRLPNRLRFVSKLESVVDRGEGKSVYLAICDIDSFRKINVSHGPRVADSILASVAERLRAAANDTAPGTLFIGRIGADQFGVIAPGVEQSILKTFLAAAERLIAEPIAIEREHISVTVSFGAALAPTDAATATELMKQAEIALKEAKHMPSGRRAFYDVRLQEKARAQARLETEVREGLERGEFVAVFQPKVKLETGELVGAEALARWRRPDGAIVSPGRFVPIAEEMGLISKLGNSVMRDACFAAAGWNKKGIVSRIAVNVSPYQFDEPDFTEQVYRALDDSGLNPELLELEITESAAVSDPDRVARIMWPLRNRGVRLAIDDFGTGHSNFASITRLPFDVFKIDQQFIRALHTDPHAPAIVEMILAMAEALGQETVAEGVETKEQADFLLRRACTIGQGYYYSPPLPAEEFDLFVRSWRPRPANRFAA